MAIVESKLKSGTLTFGADPGTPFACPQTNVRVTPSYDDDGDAVETLCGDELAAGKKETWVLAGTAIQDFDDPEGFLAYAYEHAMETIPFTWQPNLTGAPAWGGSVVVEALEEGGDVNTRLTSDWEWDVVGRPTRVYGDGAATGATAGTPGTFTPPGSTPPPDVAGMAALTANPATAWTTGQYVQTGTAGSAGEAHWSGSAWAAGRGA